MTDFEKRFQKIEGRILKIEEFLFKDKSMPKSTGFEKLLVENIEKIPIPHLTIIALRLKSKQTRQEIKKMLEDWGKIVGDWFRGGNMNNRLIKMSLVKRDGSNDHNDECFSLTKKGEFLADELIQKLKTKDG